MPDLPDYYQSGLVTLADVGSFAGGLDANKSSTPVSRDIYLATDTNKLYICFVGGTWTHLTHAGLIDLTDDDHTQYVLDSEKGAASGIATLDGGSKVVEQPASISGFLEASPTNGEAGKAPDSNWAFDHDSDEDAHHAKTHDYDEHTDVPRERYKSAREAYSADGTHDLEVGTFPVIQRAANLLVRARFSFRILPDFVSFTDLQICWSSPAAAGSMRMRLAASWGADNEAYNTHSETGNWQGPATGGTNYFNFDTGSLTLANLAIGDLLHAEVYWDAAHGNDTLDDVSNIVGMLFKYIARE